MGNFRDLTGQVFGRLTAIESTKSNKAGKAIWTCSCSCGNTVEILSERLVTGNTRSCKCLRRELSSLRSVELHRNNCRPQSARKRVFGEYNHRAKRLGFEFVLTSEQFYLLVGGNCYWCGVTPSNRMVSQGGATFDYNGIDRLNSSIGYTVGNSVSCCKICNFMKNTLSPEEFLAHIKRILDKHPAV